MHEDLPIPQGTQFHVQMPMLLRCDDLDDPARSQIHRRPDLMNAPQLPRPHTPCGDEEYLRQQ